MASADQIAILEYFRVVRKSKKWLNQMFWNHDHTTTRACVQFLIKKLEKIVKNPNKSQFRRIETSNQEWMTKVQPVVEAKELLLVLGFVLTKGNKSCLILPSSVSQDLVESALGWLHEFSQRVTWKKMLETGLTLQALQFLLETHQDVLTNGEHVVNHFVKPETISSRCSYSEMLSKVPATTQVGVCDVFVSHSWSNDFSDLVAAIESYENTRGADRQLFYFIDYFCINQHEPVPDLDFLEDMIKPTDFLLVMSPWNNPTPLTRAWCLLEISTALKFDCKIDVLFPPGEQIAFVNAITADPSHEVLKSILNINSDNAQASVESDLQNIRELLWNEFGDFPFVDKKIREFFQGWINTRVPQIIARVENQEEENTQ